MLCRKPPFDSLRMEPMGQICPMGPIDSVLFVQPTVSPRRKVFYGADSGPSTQDSPLLYTRCPFILPIRSTQFSHTSASISEPAYALRIVRRCSGEKPLSVWRGMKLRTSLNKLRARLSGESTCGNPP